MKYYINGKEVTKEQAKRQEQINKEITESNDLNRWLEIQFITVIK